MQKCTQAASTVHALCLLSAQCFFKVVKSEAREKRRPEISTNIEGRPWPFGLYLSFKTRTENRTVLCIHQIPRKGLIRSKISSRKWLSDKSPFEILAVASFQAELGRAGLYYARHNNVKLTWKVRKFATVQHCTSWNEHFTLACSVHIFYLLYR